jgi:YVTN family beta-propeller protein
VAITPDGKTAYVANTGSGSVTPIDTATGTGGSVITVGGSPHAVAVAPDGKTVYVTSLSPNSVTPIDTATGTAGNAIPVGSNPLTLAISPDQPPVAAFSVTHAHVGAAATFDASASSDQEGTIASYRWDFGDGQTATTTSAMTSHTYAAPGSYTVTVTETDDAGCSTTEIFTGQTVSCDGSSLARVSHQVSIEPPAITSASQTAFKTARAGSFTVTSTGSPTPSLSESGAMPRGVSFTDHGDGTASLAGTPEAATGGSYPITIKASNGVSPDASQTFTLTVQSPPTASIATPAAGATYAKGQVVHSSFTCDEGAGGPGIASCLDQRGRGSGALLDTSSTGHHTFSVTATSSDGLTGATPVTYTVNAPGGKPPAAPVLSGLKVRPHAFRVATKGSARSKSGATISYRDTLAAETTLRVVDRVAGVKQRGACVAAPTRKHRGTGKRCTRVLLIGSIGHRDAAGTNRLRFTGRLRGHALAPGRYKLIASARQAAQHSGTISARFRILNQ